MDDLAKKFESETITKGKDPVTKKDCIFCKLSKGEIPTTILFKNSEVTVFYDHKPAAKEHLLIIPNSHHGNAKTLKKEDLPMVEYLHAVGQGVLEQKGGSIDDARSGFHWPPFNTVDHLHLHILYPVSEMKFMGRQMYRNNSPWFATYEWLIQHLKDLPDAPSQNTSKVRAPSQEADEVDASGESGSGTAI
ncbi:histidine triad nucleotide-binding protein 3-like [Asterias rubens]|uniref:histidine triad nucleotide-binding protein 3-like n=1 Tax=Asterias rubens TaxID=7604 RepID=UPI00145556F7|nr:histidine triad nucleotide-binding protein 3-like [Asterias rubens]